MSISALDSRIFRNLFGTQKMRDVFSDTSYVRQMILVEGALASAQSRVGVIPDHVGAALKAAIGAIEIEYEQDASKISLRYLADHSS